jgi:hypothetical protein
LPSRKHAFAGIKEEGFMRTANNLEKIESQIMSLPVSEQIHLIERIARRVRSVQTKSGIALNWNDLYGMGKGIWRGDDAQDYVNRAREERI